MAAMHHVFDGREVKYRLSTEQYHAILPIVQERLGFDAHGSRLVKCVYFDTECRDLARLLRRSSDTESLCVRSRGVFVEDERVYVEAKERHDLAVRRHRIAMPYAVACAYLGGMPYEEACAAYGEEPKREQGVRESLKEIDAMLLRWGPLQPSVLVMSVRTAYGPDSKADSNGVPESRVRIAFDSSLSYRDLYLENKVVSARPLIDPGEVVMGIEVDGVCPPWLRGALEMASADASPFSKYGEASLLCAASARRSTC